MTKKQGEWYIKKRLKGGYDNLSEKSQDKWEHLEEKIRDGVTNEINKYRTKRQDLSEIVNYHE